MSIYDRINCIVGDSFFFNFLEDDIENILLEKYNRTKIKKELVLENDSISKLNMSLVPNLFDLEPKIVVVRNIKNKFLQQVVDCIKQFDNVYLIIEIEAEKYDSRVKILKELDKNDCVTAVGLATDVNVKLVEIAFNKIENAIECSIDEKAKQFLMNYTPKKEIKDKSLYNLNRIFYEVKKMSYFDKHITLEMCQNMIYKPAKHYSYFDILDAIVEKDIPKVIYIIDNFVENVGQARQLLGLISSELQIICLIKDRHNDSYNDIYNSLTESATFNLLDEDTYNKEYKKIHPYRLRKILEKKNTSYFLDCDENLSKCMIAYDDIINFYSGNFKIPLLKFLIEMCMTKDK